MFIPDLGVDLARLRREARRNQTTIAKRVGVDTARISRWESGEIAPSDAEVVAYLRAVGTPNAKEYLRFRKQKWRAIERPSFWHPDRDSLLLADRTLDSLERFCKANDVPSTVTGEIQMLRDALVRSEQFLFSLEHKVAFVGQIGVGKSTAICAVASLLRPAAAGDTLQKRAALQTGAGRITLCDVQIKRGPAFGIVIEPQSDEEIFTLVGDLCEGFFRSRDAGDEEKSDVGIPVEVERALRNMARLPKTRRAAPDGKQVMWDPVEEILKERNSVDELRAEFLARMQLSRRTTQQIWYLDGGAHIDLEWLQETFRDLNTGKRADVSLPRRVDLILPRPVFEAVDPDILYDITLIDTKGIDESPIRKDISELLTDARTLTLFSVGFNDAPGKAVPELLREASDMGFRSRISSRAALLVLPQPNQALAMLHGTDEESEGDKIGYLLKEGEIKSALTRIAFDDLPVLFFNATSDDVRGTVKQIVDHVSRMRSAEKIRLAQTRDAVRAMQRNFLDAVAVATKKEVSRRLAIALRQHEKLRRQVREAYDQLLNVLKSYHATVVWAAARRNGSYWNLDVYFHLGTGAVADARMRCQSSVDSIIGLVENMLADQELKSAHEFLKELRSNLDYWQEQFLSDVRTIGEEEFKPALKDDYELWRRCKAVWGTASGGFRADVARYVKDWFERVEREPLRASLEAKVNAAWESNVISPLRSVCMPE